MGKVSHSTFPEDQSKSCSMPAGVEIMEKESTDSMEPPFLTPLSQTWLITFLGYQWAWLHVPLWHHCFCAII